MVRVAAARLDVHREPAGLRERAEEVRGHAGLGLDRELGVRAAAEVDGGAGERVVHRHDRVAVARDPASVAEGAVERLAERERGVLDGVVVARLEVAGALDDEVEPGVEGELLEEVVVDAGAGVDAHAARAVEPEAHGDARLGGRAQVADAARGCLGHGRAAGRATRASVSTTRSSSSRSRIVIRMPSS